MPGLDPGSGKRSVVDQPDLGESIEHLIGHLVRDLPISQYVGQLGPRPRLSRELVEQDRPGDLMRIGIAIRRRVGRRPWLFTITPTTSRPSPEPSSRPPPSTSTACRTPARTLAGIATGGRRRRVRPRARRTGPTSRRQVVRRLNVVFVIPGVDARPSASSPLTPGSPSTRTRVGRRLTHAEVVSGATCTRRSGRTPRARYNGGTIRTGIINSTTRPRPSRRTPRPRYNGGTIYAGIAGSTTRPRRVRGNART